MPARVALRFAVAALLLTVGCTRAGPAPLSEADKVALRAIDQRFADAVLAKNWAGAAAVYSTEASLMQPNGPAVNGRAMIQAWLEAFPPISTLTIETQEIDGVADLAYVRGTYAMTFTLPGAPGPTEDRGKYLLIERKQTDRSWLITNEIFNSDLPLPAPK
jgi:ketosteroid isomerase-like protein